MATPNVLYEASTFQGRKLTGQRSSLRDHRAVHATATSCYSKAGLGKQAS